MVTSKLILVAQIVLLAATVIIVLNADGRGEVEVRSDQAQYKSTACYLRETGSGGCETSFKRLMGRRMGDSVKSVRLIGYLSVRNGVPMLFPDEMSYRHDVVVDAIAIQGALKDYEVLDGHWYTYVRVEGVFKDSKNLGPEPWFGELRPPLSVSEVRDVMKESPEDLRVGMEFMSSSSR